MGRKKAVKELTEKEWLEREKENGLNEIKDKLNFINPPTYEFNIGDKVKFGNLKDATVDYISKDKKVKCVNSKNLFILHWKDSKGDGTMPIQVDQPSELILSRMKEIVDGK